MQQRRSGEVRQHDTQRRALQWQAAGDSREGRRRQHKSVLHIRIRRAFPVLRRLGGGGSSQHERGTRHIPGALPGQNTGDAELLRLLHGGPVQRVRHVEYRQPRGVLPPQAQRIAETPAGASAGTGPPALTRQAHTRKGGANVSKVISVINDRIKERGVTLVFVSKQAHMKTDLLSKTLNGNRNMKADEFVNLCQVLDLTLEDFKAPAQMAE